MSSGRVLVTEEARLVARHLKDFVFGNSADLLQTLERQGDILADPNQWDGGLANQYRSTWVDDKHRVKEM
jgi:hypothetical protein